MISALLPLPVLRQYCMSMCAHHLRALHGLGELSVRTIIDGGATLQTELPQILQRQKRCEAICCHLEKQGRNVSVHTLQIFQRTRCEPRFAQKTYQYGCVNRVPFLGASEPFAKHVYRRTSCESLQSSRVRRVSGRSPIKSKSVRPHPGSRSDCSCARHLPSTSA